MPFDGGEDLQHAYAAMQLGQLPDAGLYSAVIGDLIQRVTKLEQMVYGAGLAARTPPASSPQQPQVIKHSGSGNLNYYRIKVSETTWVKITAKGIVVTAVQIDDGDDLIDVPIGEWENYIAGLPLYIPAAPTGSDPDPNFDRRSMNGDEY